MLKEQREAFIAKMKRKPLIVKSFGKKLSFSAFPNKVKEETLKRLAEKDEVMARGLLGELPGLKIDGKVVTKENIHEFELKPKKEAVSKEIRKEIVEEVYPNETEEEIYKKSDLEKLSFNELKKIAKKFGQTGRSKKGIIKDILKFQK